jgi:transmembrane sensor
MISEVSLQHAIRAWTRRRSGNWGPAVEAELQQWLTTASEHREAYEKVATAWDCVGELAGRLAVDRTSPALGGRDRNASSRRLAIAVCIAVLVGIVAVPLWRAGYRWWNGSQVRLVTLRGQPKAFALQDGTRVLLDADSELIAHMGARGRRLSLERGEALFTVVHDSSRSFEVATEGGRVMDLGTRFDVEALEGSTRVAVLEGRVGIVTSTSQSSLAAGQAGGYDRRGQLLPHKELDPTLVDWSAGQRRFDNAPLSEVLERLSRYHAVIFAFADPRARDLRVSGTFRTDNLDLLLRTLSAALPIEVRYPDPQHVEITSR